MPFDSHKAYRTLIAGGFSETQADTILDIVKDAGNEQITKNDLTAALAKLRSELVAWMFVFVVGQVGLLITIIKTMKGA